MQQPTAAPVHTIACPAYTPPTGQQAGPQTLQQAYAQRLVGVARCLEQAIPGYQVIASLIQDLVHTPLGRDLPGAESVENVLKDIAYHHSASLGAIRRFLCGEMTNEVLGALMLGVNHLAYAHDGLRPLLERWVMAAAPDQRAPLSGLAQTMAASDFHLNQAMESIQVTVGPQVWESIRAKVFGPAEAGTRTSVPPHQ